MIELFKILPIIILITSCTDYRYNASRSGDSETNPSRVINLSPPINQISLDQESEIAKNKKEFYKDTKEPNLLLGLPNDTIEYYRLIIAQVECEHTIFSSIYRLKDQTTWFSFKRYNREIGKIEESNSLQLSTSHWKEFQHKIEEAKFWQLSNESALRVVYSNKSLWQIEGIKPEKTTLEDNSMVTMHYNKLFRYLANLKNGPLPGLFQYFIAIHDIPFHNQDCI